MLVGYQLPGLSSRVMFLLEVSFVLMFEHYTWGINYCPAYNNNNVNQCLLFTGEFFCVIFIDIS